MESDGYCKDFYKGEMAERYLLHVPAYPSAVVETIIEYLEEKMPKPHTIAVDVACGTGQGTRMLSGYFDKVLGYDISPDMITIAQRNETLQNIEYSVSAAESLPVEDGTVDVITVASALHMFEFERFCKEVDRILKPGGIFAAYAYCACTNGGRIFQSEVANDLLTEYFEGIFFKNPPPSYKDCDVFKSMVENLVMPYREVKCPDNLISEREYTISGIMDLIRSFAPTKEYLIKHPIEGPKVLQQLKEGITDALKITEADKFHVMIPIPIKMARKPIK